MRFRTPSRPPSPASARTSAGFFPVRHSVCASNPSPASSPIPRTSMPAARCSAAHSAANPLTSRHGVVHGQAVGLVLPSIVRFNATEPAAAAGYMELCRAAGLPDIESLALALEETLRLAGLAAPLRSFGVTRESIPTLALEASHQWTATFNPRTITPADFARIYESLLR